MGCSLFRNEKRPRRLTSSICEKSLTSFTNNQTQPQLCKLFHFLPKNLDLFFSDIETIFGNSVTCAFEFQHLKEINQALSDALSHFEFLTHNCCIPNHSIEESLKVMIICTKLQYKHTQKIVKLNSKFPFFKFELNGINDMTVSSWEDLVYFFKVVSINNDFFEEFLHVKFVLKQIENIIVGNECYLEVIKNVLWRCVGETEENIRKVQGIKRIVRWYSERFEREESGLDKLVEMCEKNQIIGTKAVVHLLYKGKFNIIC